MVVAKLMALTVWAISSPDAGAIFGVRPAVAQASTPPSGTPVAEKTKAASSAPAPSPASSSASGDKAAQAAPAPQTPLAGSPSDAPSAEALRRKQDELARKEIALKSMEQDLNERLEKLQTIEKQIKSMLEQADAMRDQKLKHLIEAYANMKPKQAADVIATLDEDVAVRILSGMKGKMAGEILNFVEPKKAAKLSVALTKLQTPFQN